MKVLSHLGHYFLLMFSRFRLPTRRFQSLLLARKNTTRSQPQQQRAISKTTTTMCKEPSPNNKTGLPPSLTGPPRSALVPPGQCQFGPDFAAVPLLERVAVGASSCWLRFATPDSTRPLNLSTCACLLAHAKMGDGEDVTRPYTPISTNADVGTFDLLVKNYGPTSHMSHYLCDVLQPGETVRFKHIDFNVKIQAETLFDQNFTHIGMCVGGTGLTPMVQALHAILGSNHQNNKKKIKVTMLYGSKTSDDILGRELLDRWAADYADQFQLVHILSDEPADSDWRGERGFIDQARIQKYFPAANASAEKLLIFVCGPPPMYAALSGPRDDQDAVSGVLGELGYSKEQVYKF